MKKIFFFVIIVSVLAGAYFVFSKQDKTKTEYVSDTPSVKVENNNLTQKNNQSRYKEYSNEILEANEDKNRVLFFYANWCSTCRPVDKEISENADKIPEDFVIIRVNYNDSDTDSNEELLAQKYSVTYQHTFFEIDKSGDVIQSWNGGNFNDLLSKITR